MAKIVLDPEESAIEAFAKLFLVLQETWGFRTKRRVKHSKTPLRQQKMLRPRRSMIGMGRLRISNGYYKESSTMKCRKND